MVSLKSFVFLAWISFGLGSVLYAVLATAYDRMIIFKEPIPDKALLGHVIATGQVPNEGSCRVKCYLEPNCVSINVGPGTKAGQLTCELNNHTDESSSGKHILWKEEPGFTHYSVENICLHNPCHGINAFCQVGFSSSGYRCACVAGHTPAADCREPLGMENGDIRDEQISASSARSNDLNAAEGRLNLARKGGAWVPFRSNSDQWLQIDLISKYTIVTGVATQGRKKQDNSGRLWVTKYKLQYDDDGKMFKDYTEKHTNGGEKVFAGNTDQDTVLRHDLNPPIRARYIRFVPKKWKGRIAMRVELYGCQNCVSGAASWAGSNYVLFTKRRTWDDARANCQRLGADLVKIESAGENNFIKMKFLNNSGLASVGYWIGLSNQVHEGERWMWTDGSSIDITFRNWKNDIQHNNRGDCAVIVDAINWNPSHFYHYDTEWVDWRCGDEQGYICEMGQF